MALQDVGVLARGSLVLNSSFIEEGLCSVNMKVYGAFVKLKFFIYAKPPVVLFTLALAILALGSTFISMYIKKTDLTVDSATKSWDAFLENLSSLEFCINSTDAHHGQPLAHSPQPKVNIGSFTFPMVLTIQHPSQATVPHKFAFLTLLVDLTQLGFKSWPADGLNTTNQSTAVEISVPIPSNSNVSSCSDNCNLQAAIHTCVTVRGPPSSLPSSVIIPQTCKVQVNSSDESRYLAKMVAFKKSQNQNPCGSAPTVWLSYKHNPALVAYFSMDDKSLINLHLFYTSFFLFVMVFMILTFALLKGKLPKAAHDTKPPGGVCPDITNGSAKAEDMEMLLDES